MAMKYPCLEIQLDSIRSNAKTLCNKCAEYGISLTAVIKGCGGDEQVARALMAGEIKQLASSRLEHLVRLRKAIPQAELMMLRMPMLSEVQTVVQVADISVNSEEITLIQLNKAATDANRVHGVLLMFDVGDLREGVFDENELLQLAAKTEGMDHLYLVGIGSSFGCFGGVLPDNDNLTKLAQAAKKIEQIIGRELELVSGGGSIALPAMSSGIIPPGINHLRPGGFLINPRSMRLRRNFSLPEMLEDTFTLSAEVIEVKNKTPIATPSAPRNWRGEVLQFKNKGEHRRAVIALGSADVMEPMGLTPLLRGIEIIGASSDHLVLDVTYSEIDIQTGDFIRFSLLYEHLLFASANPGIRKMYLRGKKK